jgi:hypothetical protein
MKTLFIDLGAFYLGFILSLAFYWLVSVSQNKGEVSWINTKKWINTIDEYVIFGIVCGLCSFFVLSYGVDILVSFKLIDPVKLPEESYIHAFVTGLLVIKTSQILIKLVK